MTYRKMVFRDWVTGKIIEERLVELKATAPIPAGLAKVSISKPKPAKASTISPAVREFQLLEYAKKLVAEEDARKERDERLRAWYSE
jgi:hypothetical protein